MKTLLTILILMLGTIWVSAQRGSHVPAKQVSFSEQELRDMANEKAKHIEIIREQDTLLAVKDSIISNQAKQITIMDSIHQNDSLIILANIKTAGLNLKLADHYYKGLQQCVKEERKERLKKWLWVGGMLVLGLAIGTTGTLLIK